VGGSAFLKRMNTFKRIALAGTAACGMVTLGLVSPAVGGPVQIQAGCEFRLVLVKANELQESDGRDEIFMDVGDDQTQVVRFTEGQTRLGSEFGGAAQTTEFIAQSGRIGVTVRENDWPSQDENLGGFAVYCNSTALGRHTQTVTGFGSDYDVTFDVIGLP
jgi:hypothetical protein